MVPMSQGFLSRKMYKTFPGDLNLQLDKIESSTLALKCCATQPFETTGTWEVIMKLWAKVRKLLLQNVLEISGK